MGKGGAASGKSGGAARNFDWQADDAYEQVDRYFESQVTSWGNKLSDDEKSAIWDYTDYDYQKLNPALREGKHPDTKLLDSAISKFELKEDLIVYRATSFDITGTPKVGKTITDKAFGSTNVLNEVSGYGEYKYQIRVPKGKGRGAFIKPFSSIPEENEFLLKRNTKYRIDKVSGKTVYMTVVS